MATISIMKVLTTLVILGIVVSVFGSILSEYGNPNQAQSYNVTAFETNRSFSNNVLNPLSSTTRNSVNLSDSLANSSSSIGFSFAFIINNFGNLLTSIVQAPRLMGNYVSLFLSNVGIIIPGDVALTSVATNAIVSLLTMYIILLFVSAWQKFPLV